MTSKKKQKTTAFLFMFGGIFSNQSNFTNYKNMISKKNKKNSALWFWAPFL